MKKLISVFCALLLAGTLWAGGGGDTAAEMEGPVVITGSFRLPPDEYQFDDSWLDEYINKTFNADLQLVAEKWDQPKEQLMLTTGDFPDFLGNIGWASQDQMDELGRAGILQAVSDHFDKLPNLMKFFEKFPLEQARNTSTDGKMYFVPSARGFSNPSKGTFVRTDLLDKQGFDFERVNPGEFSDHLDMYKAIRDEWGDYPLASRKGLYGCLQSTMGPMGLMDGNAPYGVQYYIEAEDRFDFAFRHPDTKFAIEFLRTLYDEKVLDTNILTMTEDEYEPQQALLKWPIVWADSYGFGLQRATLAKAQDPNFEQEWASVLPPLWKGKLVPWRNSYISGRVMVVNSKIDPAVRDKFYEVCNWAFTTKANDMMTYGRENIDFVYVDGDLPVPLFYIPGQYEYKFPEGFKFPRPLGNKEDWIAMRAEHRVYLKPFQYLGGNERASTTLENVLPPETNYLLQDWIPKYGKQVYLAPPMPTYRMGDDTEEILSLRNSLMTAVEESVSKMMTGLSPMSEWDKLQSTLTKIGVDRYVELINKAYQAGKM